MCVLSISSVVLKLSVIVSSGGVAWSGDKEIGGRVAKLESSGCSRPYKFGAWLASMFSDSGSTLAGDGLSVCSTRLFWIVDVTVMNLVFFTEPTCEKREYHKHKH